MNLYLVPFSLLDLREFVVIEVIIRIHVDYLSLCRSSQHFDDLNQMVDAAFSDKKRRSLDHFQQDASD